MVRLFVRHNVDDYSAWRRVYGEFEPQHKAMGVTAHAVFQSVDEPNDITVWHDFDSAETARAFTSSEELRDAMQRAGVRGEPQVWFVSPA